MSRFPGAPGGGGSDDGFWGAGGGVAAGDFNKSFFPIVSLLYSTVLYGIYCNVHPPAMKHCISTV